MKSIPPSGGTSNAVMFPPVTNVRPLRRQQWLQYAERAVQFMERGEKAEAEAMWRLAVKHAERDRAAEHEFGGVLLGLAELLYSDRRPQDALEYCQRALACLTGAYGDRHPKVAGCLNLEASIHFAQGNYSAAFDACSKAHAIFERALGDRNSDTVVTTYNLAMINHALGRFLHAERFYRRSLALIKTTVCISVSREAMIENYAHLLDRTNRAQEAAQLRLSKNR
ncbi:MAG TPA: tetratricopeptide repeat protein [Chroococcales cyanobacterium]